MRFLEDEWREELIWCPSQCYRKFEFCGIEYELYLRWRWNDPWTGNIIRTDSTIKDDPILGDGGWSPDLFAWGYVQYPDKEYKKAEVKLEELAFKWLIENAKQGCLPTWDSIEMQ